jgi:NAD(P)-dependent dehydrogenase (short-subunit alcohol dehydrogenase family)
MLADLTGRVAVVTAAGSGIGRGIARALSSHGAGVAVTDRDKDLAAQTAALLPGQEGMALTVDVTEPDSIHAAIGEVHARWQRIDILVNNAGVPADPQRESDWDREIDWDQTFDVNVKGTVRCCEACLPGMQQRGYGKIVNVGLMAAHAQRRTYGAYAATKAAVLRYTKGLAMALASHQINVNAVCPGAVWTSFQQRDTAPLVGEGADETSLKDAFESRYADVIPLGRPQTAEDIGDAVSFLVSDAARSITGQCLHVDGGATLRD